MEPTETSTWEAGGVHLGQGAPFFLIAGPCVIESEQHCLDTAGQLAEICLDAEVPLIFKSSYDKANRTSLGSYRGPGIEEGLRILSRVRDVHGLPLLSDVHGTEQVAAAAEVLDVIQIPAFLCRQTDLLTAAGACGRTVNLKKGQFLAPWDLQSAVGKLESAGCRKILLTERGSSFGYNNLVLDMRSLPLLRRSGYPVVLDVTHGLQLPGGMGGSSGGQSEFIPHLARAGAGCGVDGLFLEVHPAPEAALCDGPNSLRLDRLAALLAQVTAIDTVVRQRPAKTEGDSDES